MKKWLELLYFLCGSFSCFLKEFITAINDWPVWKWMDMSRPSQRAGERCPLASCHQLIPSSSPAFPTLAHLGLPKVGFHFVPPPNPPSAPSLTNNTLVSNPGGQAHLRHYKNTDITPASLIPIFADLALQAWVEVRSLSFLKPSMWFWWAGLGTALQMPFILLYIPQHLP